MSNTNCLSGLRCPKCGNKEPLNIAVTLIMQVYDNGTELEYHDVEWNDDSYCECPNCYYHATIKDFKCSST